MSSPINVVVQGFDLPGLQCHPDADGKGYANVHVGLCDRSWKGPPTVEPRSPWGVRDLVPGNAKAARWEFEVQVKEKDGALDFGGPLVRGNRGDRHIALFWGALPSDEVFETFRGAKLKLETVDPKVIRAAAKPGKYLNARIRLTDGKGNPVCATVKAPDLVWSVEAI
jgi:hypothetical protein